ncbi:C2 family cysteine protease [Nostoc sp.]|uniref:C2 family cysteine protease n=1 Tax=Nostoc sp. TaxID=1180 RepID=UPI002FFC3C99
MGKWFLGNDRPDAYSYNGSTQYTYQYVSGSLFQNSISSDDIHQGDLGDCYLLATLSSLANDKSSYIQKMFIDNGDNTFAVRFYNNGIADYVTVDRYLPTLSNGKAAYAGWGGASYSSLSNELWVALVEKAYAQINESGWIGQDNTNSYLTADPNYSRTKSNSTGINGGNEYKVMSQITALDSRITSNATQQDTINLVNSNNLVTFGINAKIFGDQYSGGHALAVTSYNSITNKFHLDNPWGSDDLHLTWQDLIKWSSSGWSYTTV